MVWSMSQRVADRLQPGKRQVRSRARIAWARLAGELVAQRPVCGGLVVDEPLGGVGGQLPYLVGVDDAVAVEVSRPFAVAGDRVGGSHHVDDNFGASPGFGVFGVVGAGGAVGLLTPAGQTSPLSEGGQRVGAALGGGARVGSTHRRGQRRECAI